MRKMIIFFSFEILLICSFFTYKVYKQQQKEKLAEEHKLAILYEWQNKAFMIYCNHEELFRYQGADKCNLQELLVYLHVYNSIQDGFNGYLMSRGYTHLFRRMPYEEAVAAFEEYKNSSEYEPPHLEERAKASS